MDGVHYIDNHWVKRSDLKISVFDLSVVRGYGCFDFLRTYKNKPFHLNDHLIRLFCSAKLLGLKVPQTKKEIGKIIKKGIQKNNFKETNIKIIITGGETKDGITPVGRSSLIINFTPGTIYPRKYFGEGIKLITTPMARIIPKAKSLNYLAGVLALVEAKKKNAVEALYVDPDSIGVDDTQIFECVTSNFLAVIDGSLVTPKEKILLGVTRKIVINLAKKLGIKVVERSLLTAEIKSFSEAFITASNKEIMPVIKIDKQIIGSGKVGDLTKKLMKEFKILTDHN